MEKLPAFHLIAVVADQKLRFERIHKRRENANDATITWDDFQKESVAEPEMKIRQIIGRAEFTIDNNGTVDDMKRTLDEIIGKINETPA